MQLKSSRTFKKKKKKKKTGEIIITRKSFCVNARGIPPTVSTRCAALSPRGRGAYPGWGYLPLKGVPILDGETYPSIGWKVGTLH